ncbi:MAG: hypothetical protein ACRD2E_11030 [Terriglobales bacterium]
MASNKTEAALQRITEWLQAVYGPALVSLTLYGSRAETNGHRRHAKASDVNLLCVLDHVSADRLSAGAEAMRWWQRQGHKAIALLSRDEARDAADVFPIEYLDLQHHRQVLAGEDLFASAGRFPREHRQQVEHDLRAQLLRLRGRYSLATDGKALRRLIVESCGTFVTLFRHALAALGEPLVQEKEAIVAATASRFGFAPEPWLRILRARHGTEDLPSDRSALQPIFAAYLEDIQTVERQLESA